jgi:hypothetical protein
MTSQNIPVADPGLEKPGLTCGWLTPGVVCRACANAVPTGHPLVEPMHSQHRTEHQSAFRRVSDRRHHGLCVFGIRA